jgi:HPt (histidine-containing phosphotransfer) domain-containing protein
VNRDLRARFLRKFLDGARDRVTLGLEAIAHGEPRGAWGQLHALAGEAAILGLPDLAEDARVGSEAAKRWMDREEETTARDECARALHRLDASVARLDEEERTKGPAAQ